MKPKAVAHARRQLAALIRRGARKRSIRRPTDRLAKRQKAAARGNA